jgi:hypothetical protein
MIMIEQKFILVTTEKNNIKATVQNGITAIAANMITIFKCFKLGSFHLQSPGCLQSCSRNPMRILQLNWQLDIYYYPQL